MQVSYLKKVLRQRQERIESDKHAKKLERKLSQQYDAMHIVSISTCCT